MARAFLDVRWNRLLVVGGAIGMAAGSRLLAADTAWLAPVSGSFFDPGRWSAGVPTSTSAVTFGGAAGTEPFVVSVGLDATVTSLAIVNQSPRIEIGDSAHLKVSSQGLLSVKPPSPMVTPAIFSGGFLSANTASFKLGTWVEFEGLDVTLGPVELAGSLMALRDGTTMHLQHLTTSSTQPGSRLEVTGAGTSLVADDSLACGWIETATLLRVGNGGVVTAPSVGCGYGNAIEFEFGPSGGGMVEATTSFHGSCAVHLSVTDASVITYNAWIPLIASPEVVLDFRPVTVDSPLPYPPIFRLAAAGFEVMFPDHVDSLSIKLPDFAVPGYRFPCTAVVTIDGVDYDVSKTASWHVDSGDGSFPASGEWLPHAAGLASISASFGDRNASATAVASPLLPPLHVIDATALEGAVPNGASGDSLSSYGRSVSRDGSRVVFASRATNLVSTPALRIGAPQQVYLNDVATGSRTMISVTSDGTPSPKDANRPVISPDGRYAAFVSQGKLSDVAHASFDFVPYLRDLERGTIEPLVLTADGLAASGLVGAISEGGRYVLVTTKEALVPEDGNGKADCYRIDRWLGSAALVSVSADGTQFADQPIPVDMTPDGATAAFYAQYLAADSENYFQGHLFVKRLEGGELINVSAPLPPLSLYWGRSGGALSSDGRFVAFMARAQSIGATNGFEQALLRDLESGSLTPLSQLPDGTWADGWVTCISISDDARFVSFTGPITSLLPSALPPFPEVSPFGSALHQTFLLDRVTGELTILTQAPNGEYCFPKSDGPWSSISGDGRTVAFSSTAASIVPFAQTDVRRVLLRRSTSWVDGDANRDGTVNGADIARVIEVWGTADIGADLNLDNTVDARDLALVLGEFGL